MLKFRIIARLDIKAPDLIKTVKCEGVRKLGNPADFARRYNDAGIDELLYLDIVASLYQRNSLGPLLDETTADVFTPVTSGGGVRCLPDARHLLNSGADKVCVNTAAIARPGLVDELAGKFGSSTIVVQIDAKRREGWWEALVDGGRQRTATNAVDWAKEVAQRGAGEILLTSVDQEGTYKGIDSELAEEVCPQVPIPVIVSGGVASPGDAVEAWRCGASGVCIAGAFHLDRFSIDGLKSSLDAAGVPIRRTS